jgi:hypothetical protein
MIPIHKCDKQRSSKSLVVLLSAVTLSIVLVGFLGDSSSSASAASAGSAAGVAASPSAGTGPE